MRSRLIAALAFVLVGCFGPASQIDPKSSVMLSGVVQTQNGTAASPTMVKLIRHPDALQALSQVIVAVGTVGLACIDGRLDICSSFEESASGSDGGYSFAMRGADTQGSTGEALTFTVFAACGPPLAPATRNCAVASDFIVQRTILALPPLRQWSALGNEDDGGVDPRFSWPSLQATIGGGVADDYTVNISDGAGNVIWIQDAVQATQASIDRRVAEDAIGSWSVTARRKQSGNGSDFTFNWYSSGLPFRGRGLLPLSRAADCYVQGANGPVKIAQPCALTDGNWATKFQPLPAPPCPMGQTCTNPPQNNWIAIDLGAAHSLATLVLYDVAVSAAATTIAVETANDLASWTLQTTVPARPYQIVPLNATAQFVRLRIVAADGSFVGGANGEIAIYPPGI
jgi:hypothetical protein